MLPLFVMAEKMVTGDVLAHGKLQGVRLRFLLQVSSGFADRFAEYVLSQRSPAWELLRGHLGGDGIGNGRHALGWVVGVPLRHHIAREPWASLVWIHLGGMRDFFFSLDPGKARINA